MSSFIVSDDHISMMLTAGLTLGHPTYRPMSWYHGDQRYQLTELNASAVGQMLVDANYASVNARYRENETPERYRYPRTAMVLGRPATAVEVLKGISCYEYQSCDIDTFADSQAHAFCEALRSTAINALAGYDEAPWEWSMKPATSTRIV